MQKRNKHIIIGLVSIVIFFVLISTYLLMNHWYLNHKHSIISPKINTLNTFISDEKDWIIENQSPDGYIFMNYSESEASAGDVNPYFASLAAQGLLTGDVRDSDLRAVSNYITWHSTQFIQNMGELDDYTLQGDQLIVSNQADSVDSYIAVFLSLLSAYDAAGGTLPEQSDDIIALALDKLGELTTHGLTAVSFDSPVVYYMDNIEVQAGYRDILPLLVNDASKTDINNRIKKNQDSLNDILWNESKERFEVGLDDAGGLIEASDMTRLYPDAIVQIYHIAFDISPLDPYQTTDLYDSFNTFITWDQLEAQSPDAFLWSELFYIAALMDDIDRAENYFDAYQNKISQSRAYPFHTATAGWAIKGADALAHRYEEWMTRSLIHDFFNKTIIK